MLEPMGFMPLFSSYEINVFKYVCVCVRICACTHICEFRLLLSPEEDIRSSGGRVTGTVLSYPM